MSNNSYFVLLTNAGAALQTNAWQGGDKINLTHFVIGSNNSSVSATQTEVLAPATEKLVINDLKQKADDAGVLEVTCIIEPSVGGFMMNSIGLYTDAGVLFAVANLPSDYKPVAAEGSSKETVITLYIALGNTDTINLTIDPYKVLATQNWVENEANIVRSFNGKTGDVTSDDLNIPVNNMTLWLDTVNGDDNNDGLTADKPLKTLGNVLSVGRNSVSLQLNVFGDLLIDREYYTTQSKLHIISQTKNGKIRIANKDMITNPYGTQYPPSFHLTVPSNIVFNHWDIDLSFGGSANRRALCNSSVDITIILHECHITSDGTNSLMYVTTKGGIVMVVTSHENMSGNWVVGEPAGRLVSDSKKVFSNMNNL